MSGTGRSATTTLSSETRDNQTDLKGFVDLMKDTPDKDQLWVGNLMQAKHQEHEKLVIRQLRIDAGTELKKDGEYALPDGIRIRGGEPGEGD